jgi:hypothetical protein
MFLKPFQGEDLTITLSDVLELQRLCSELGADIFDDDIIRVLNEAGVEAFIHVTRTALDLGHSTIDFEHQFSQRFHEVMNHPDFLKFPGNMLLRILKDVPYDLDLLLNFCFRVIETQGSPSSTILCILNPTSLNQTHFDHLMLSDCVNLFFVLNLANFLLCSIHEHHHELQNVRNHQNQNYSDLDTRLAEQIEWMHRLQSPKARMSLTFPPRMWKINSTDWIIVSELWERKLHHIDGHFES